GLLTNLNNSMEKEYVGDQESISTRQKEDEAVQFLDGIENLILTLRNAGQGETVQTAEARDAVDQLLIGDPYFISYDNSTLIIEAIPTFTVMDRDLVMSSTQAVQALVDGQLEEYPDVRAGLTGSVAREHDEQTYATRSIQYTTIIAFVAIFVMLILAFRMWVAPVLAMFNLVIGLIWAMGIAYITQGQLNMVTSMMSVILLGLGIDFSIHLISSFTEWRAKGDNIHTSMEKAFMKSGKGIVTGALTTACAFLTLIVSKSQGMESMGIVTGSGLIAILLATMFFLPVLLVFRARYRDKKQAKKPAGTFVERDISLHALGRMGEWLGRRYVFSIGASILLTGFMVWAATQIKYDQNYMNMEPEGLTSIALMDTIKEKFDLSMEYAISLAQSVEESRQLAEEYRDMTLVAMTDDISLYLPSPEEQQERIPHINGIRQQMSIAPIRQAVRSDEYGTLISEIERLEMNIMEIQDMAFLGGQDKVDKKCGEIVGFPNQPNSHNIMTELLAILKSDESAVLRGFTGLQRNFSPYFKQTVLNMASTEPVHLEDLPAPVLDRYSNRTRDKFLITIYPQGNLYEDARLLTRFVDELDRINPQTTGGPPLGVAMLRIFARDGRNAVLLTLLIVFLLLWADFRKARRALIAMVPLALGAVWMVGLMYLTGMNFTFMNFLAVPLIIGIGIDDGVHIMHRWLNEGRTNLQVVFASTGKAILLTSLTTMLAFGSMHFSVFPAWAWFGEGLFLGVGACFITSVLVLPGILGWRREKHVGKYATPD
ncbi:MAG TPA: efflux RND transporter permease subunit, partial [bacterium]|nr:efflux RND transporter permease subunit [bacterium]